MRVTKTISSKGEGGEGKDFKCTKPYSHLQNLYLPTKKFQKQRRTDFGFLVSLMSIKLRKTNIANSCCNTQPMVDGHIWINNKDNPAVSIISVCVLVLFVCWLAGYLRDGQADCSHTATLG